MATVIHAGWPKTGTTSLQRRFFPRIPDSALLQPAPRTSPFRQLVSTLQNAADDDYEPEMWSSFLEESRADASLLIVSWEGLCRGRQPQRTIQRLHDASPDARVFLCVRSQVTMLRSRYAEYVRAGGYRAFPAWLARSDPSYEMYDVVVERYQRLFGPDRVLVLAYEQLAANAPSYLARVAEFVSPGVELAAETAPLPRDNPAMTAPSRWATRHSNRLFRRSKWNPKPPLAFLPGDRVVRRIVRAVDPALPPTFRRQSSEHRGLLEDWCRQFTESNDRLRDLTGLPLAALGYPLPVA